MEKAFSRGKTGKWPEKRRTGKRANEIECPEKGKGKAPDLKSEARSVPFLIDWGVECEDALKRDPAAVFRTTACLLLSAVAKNVRQRAGSVP